ncbi:MAG: helix-turn-helix domain-containing protein [Nanoarchaeota archaeon]|nr:helix-turn-helix domain-containing protein [Nanoarchaeota archaeon]
MAEKFVLVSLEEDKAKHLAEVLSNKTARLILNYLSEHEEATETTVAKDLQLPLSTVHYNLQNLKKTGLVETEEFQWSSKGKQQDLYKLAKKFIVIQPKGTTLALGKLQNLFIVSLLSGLGATVAGFLAKGYFMTQNTGIIAEAAPALAMKTAALTAEAPPLPVLPVPGWLYYATFFCIGALFTMIIYSCINWKKR